MRKLQNSSRGAFVCNKKQTKFLHFCLKNWKSVRTWNWQNHVKFLESRNFGKVWQTTENAEHLQMNADKWKKPMEWMENNETARQKWKAPKKWETRCMLQKRKRKSHVGNRRNRENLVWTYKNSKFKARWKLSNAMVKNCLIGVQGMWRIHVTDHGTSGRLETSGLACRSQKKETIACSRNVIEILLLTVACGIVFNIREKIFKNFSGRNAPLLLLVEI